jgi:hypothetical protein
MAGFGEPKYDRHWGYFACPCELGKSEPRLRKNPRPDKDFSEKVRVSEPEKRPIPWPVTGAEIT